MVNFFQTLTDFITIGEEVYPCELVVSVAAGFTDNKDALQIPDLKCTANT
jgi:hypothetical protein